MTNEEKPYPSRLKKKKEKNRSNSILNIMIGLVFALILIIGVSMLFSGGDDQANESEEVAISTGTEEQTSGSDDGESASAGDEDEDAEAKAEEEAAKKAKEEKEKEEEGSVTKGGTITREDSSDPIVDETVINTSWEPVGTKQKGDHVSVYQKDSVDWNEKVKAVSYATGLDSNNMYVMMIKNGGGPQKSIATVQSKDESEKYRVHLEWVDGEGWKPVKMDVLKTLQGAY
ncbi:DUF1510 family protein [Microbacterium sp. APC 3898]|uniref:DUF1510 family protein n=1 Tax=Planococcus notacanthi TaxID=3035188 RepID=A0ABT7ZIA8_9BACL|nr:MULTISPECIES: DUF1510 family protein [Terrabacteria group]MDN3426885.1 DUF1510 family protein [Planococcus sp. APC 4016]MDN3499967.1 DUF1510 family protein [Microbacterium sp. APC 3898]